MRNNLAESVLSRKKDREIFNYSDIISDAWHPVIQKGKAFQKVNFDLENNDSTGQKKTFLIPKDLRKGQPIKYEINAELWEAGGDWEWPVMYFKLQFTHDYGLVRFNKGRKVEYVWDQEKDYKGLYNGHVIIPPIKAGNKLTKYADNAKDKYHFAAWQDESIKAAGLDPKDIKITDADKKKAWDWLDALLHRLVDERHEMLDTPDHPDPSPDLPEAVKESVFYPRLKDFF